MRKKSLKSLFFRSFIVLFWIGVISAFLFWSNFHSGTSKNTITIFTWGDLFSDDIIRKFEKESGIKVKFNYYASNEELLVKLKAMKGKGCDLIIPSDYAVNLLIKEDMLAPLDSSKLTCKSDIHSFLLSQEFDPENRYSLPVQWEVFGFGYDTEHFKTEFFPSFHQIFDPKANDSKIAMVNDPIEALNFASFYLFGRKNVLNKLETKQIKELLHRQKSFVEAYVNQRAEHLLGTKNCPLAILPSSSVWRMNKQFPHISFKLPVEGVFMTIENVAIPKKSEQVELVYKFLDFLYKPENITKQCNEYCVFSPLDRESQNENTNFTETLKTIQTNKKNIYLFNKQLLSEKETRDLWIDLKSKKK